MALGGEHGGDRWYFIVDTDSYAGNFERELCAYVIGAAGEHGAHVAGPYLKLFRMWCPVELGSLSDTRIADSGDDGTRESPCDLAPTPGWSNNGNGKSYRVRPNNKRYRYKHPAYNSVALFLRRRPSDDELTELVKRALEFPTLQKVHPWEARPTEILGCRLLKEAVQVDYIHVPLETANSAVRVDEPKEAALVPGPEPGAVPNAVYARLR
jgi:hypothetical protein